MKKIQYFWLSLSERKLIWISSLIAALIAIRILWMQHGWVNDDSVLYFEMARLFSLDRWHEAIELFRWPLYPLLIAGLHKLTGFSFERSAQVLSILFYAMTNYSMVTLIQLAGGNKCTILLGSLLLWSSLYITGDVLGMLLRDQGFWAFFLISIVYFVRFYRSESLTDALLWQLSAIIATLFRIEAITYLTLLPLILLLRSTKNIKEKLLLLLKSYSIVLALLVLILILLTFNKSVSISNFGRLQEVLGLFAQNSNDILHVFYAKSDLFGGTILGGLIDEYATLGLSVTLLLIVIIKCAVCAGLLPLVLVTAYRKSFSSNTVMQADTSKIFFYVALLATLNAIVIIFRSYVLSGRYVIAFGFILLIFAAFVFAKLWHESRNDRIKQCVFVLFVVLIGLCIVKNLWAKPDGYNFEQDAVRYAQTLEADPTKIFYVSPRARYYAGIAFNERGYEYWPYITQAIKNKTIQNYDVLVLNIARDDEKNRTLKRALPAFTLKKVFFDARKRKSVMVFTRTN